MFRKQDKGWARKDGLVKEESLLHAIRFHRVILDEAHNIKVSGHSYYSLYPRIYLLDGTVENLRVSQSLFCTNS